MAAPFSMSKESEKYVAIANQCRNTGVALSKDSLRSQSAFPCKCETDEGLASPYGRGAPAGAERACFTLSVGFAASSPKVGAKGERIATPVCALARNDSIFCQYSFSISRISDRDFPCSRAIFTRSSYSGFSRQTP